MINPKNVTHEQTWYQIITEMPPPPPRVYSLGGEGVQSQNSYKNRPIILFYFMIFY